MKWIDTHVHVFSANDNNDGIPKLLGTDQCNTAEIYREKLASNLPQKVVIVDFSKAKDSTHVIHSLDEWPHQDIEACGIIKADISNPNTFEWIKRPDIKGIRLYALADIPDLSQEQEKWQELFDYITAEQKQVLVFGKTANVTATIKQIPTSITVLVDHLGMPDLQAGPDNADYSELLALAKERGNVFFKGPGYRTSIEPQKMLPFVDRIVSELGYQKVLLGTSDAPFAGPIAEQDSPHNGKPFGECMNYETVIDYVKHLAQTGRSEEIANALFYDNAAALY